MTKTSFAMSSSVRPRLCFSFILVNAQTFACDKADRVPLRPPVQNFFAVLPDAVLGIASEEAE